MYLGSSRCGSRLEPYFSQAARPLRTNPLAPLVREALGTPFVLPEGYQAGSVNTIDGREVEPSVAMSRTDKQGRRARGPWENRRSAAPYSLLQAYLPGGPLG